MDAIEILADYAINADYNDLSLEAVVATRKFIQDSLGVGLVGSSAPKFNELRRAAALWGKGSDARVWASSDSLPASSAALVNAFLMHNSEFDCIHEEAVVHCVTVVLASTLADAEKFGNISGKELIAAVAIGVDVACIIGASAKSGLRFFRPATAGAFAATMGVGKLRGFNKHQLINACAIVFGQIGGTMQAHKEGSSLLAMQMGFAARNALIACDLASKGIDGPTNILEGEFGYFNLIEIGYDFGNYLSNLGKNWLITEVSHKPFPSGRATHGIVDCCLGLRQKHNFDIKDIERVICYVPPLVCQLVGRPPKKVMEPNYARLCGPYVVATALKHGTVEVKHFRQNRIPEKEVFELANNVILQINDNKDPNALAPLSVSILLRGGIELSAARRYVLGHPKNPLSRRQHIAKFRSNCASASPAVHGSKIEALIKRTDQLEEETDVARIIDLITK